MSRKFSTVTSLLQLCRKGVKEIEAVRERCREWTHVQVFQYSSHKMTGYKAVLSTIYLIKMT